MIMPNNVSFFIMGNLLMCFEIAEANMITVAAGLAAGGKIPLTHCHRIFALGKHITR